MVWVRLIDLDMRVMAETDGRKFEFISLTVNHEGLIDILVRKREER